MHSVIIEFNRRMKQAETDEHLVRLENESDKMKRKPIPILEFGPEKERNRIFYADGYFCH